MGLTFGYNAGLPDGVRAAWGARFIFPDDLLYDRTGIFGDEDKRKALVEWLNSGALGAARDEAGRLADSYALRNDETREVVLYEDDEGKIVGNPNRSFGYLYVAGWLKADVPVADGERGPIYADTTDDGEITEIADATGVYL
jgi:hypothetical protein